MEESKPSTPAIPSGPLADLFVDPSPTHDPTVPIQSDLFVFLDAPCDFSVKEDISSMEYPIFSLTKKPDTRLRTYSRGGKVLRIIPSVVGAATVFDKDLLIYCISQMVRSADAGAKVSRRIRLQVYPFLVGTRRSKGGAAYERVLDMCRRLKGTTIETNVKTTDNERTHGFGLIEDYCVTQYTKSGKGALELELILPDWLMRQVLDYDILTLNQNYFSLSQPLERRLYELARKHCGDKAFWKCNVDLLQEKSGSTQESKSFMNDLRKIAKADSLPDYKLAIDERTKPAHAVFFSRDMKKVLFELNRANLMGWFSDLMQGRLPKSGRTAG